MLTLFLIATFLGIVGWPLYLYYQHLRHTEEKFQDSHFYIMLAAFLLLLYLWSLIFVLVVPVLFTPSPQSQSELLSGAFSLFYAMWDTDTFWKLVFVVIALFVLAGYLYKDLNKDERIANSVAFWQQQNQQTLYRLNEAVTDPHRFWAEVSAGIKHKLPPAILSELETIVREWLAQRIDRPTAEQYIEMVRAECEKAYDTFRNERTKEGKYKYPFLVDASYLSLELHKALNTPAVSSGPLVSLLNRVFYWVPHPSMIGSFSEITVADGIPPDERTQLLNELLLLDPSRHLQSILDISYSITLPEEKRTEHTHIVAPSGHGKTTALQSIILEDGNKDNAAQIIIDSQGQLIPFILRHTDRDPSDYVIIDASDVDYPVALNPFAISRNRLDAYSAKDREQVTNTVIELYEWMFSSILEGSELTGKQGGLFRYVCRLMLVTPGATMHTMLDVLENGTAPYQAGIAQLSPIAQQFFTGQFKDKEYNRTKGEVLRRLYQLLENDSFARMFLQEDNRVDVFEAMQNGQIVLVNTALSHLRETGSRVLGRFMIALVQMAAQERALASFPPRAYVYIDEVHEYFSGSMARLFEQSRKANVAITIAHQGMYQLPADLAGAIRTNTSIKLAANLTPEEANAVARMMRTEPEMLQQPRGSFLCSIRGVGVVPMRFTPVKSGGRSRDEVYDIIEASRATYAGQYVPPSPPHTDHTDHTDEY